MLTTNGTSCDVAQGFLAIAPRGTWHGICNTSSREELALLVVELVPPQDEHMYQSAEIPSLPAMLADSAAFHPASLGTQHIRLRAATVDLARSCSAPWGRLALVEIPPGGRVHPYAEEAHDENLFVLSGNAAITVAEERFYSWEQGLNVLVPRGLPPRYRQPLQRGTARAPVCACLSGRRGRRAVMSADLRDKVVCITGAAGGIGRAIAKAFAWEGADLALLDRDKTGVEELAAALRTTGVTVQTTVVDLRTAHGVREGMQAALAPLGGVLDILVPNVGALIAGPFETLESGSCRKLLRSTSSRTSMPAAWRFHS